MAFAQNHYIREYNAGVGAAKTIANEAPPALRQAFQKKKKT